MRLHIGQLKRLLRAWTRYEVDCRRVQEQAEDWLDQFLNEGRSEDLIFHFVLHLSYLNWELVLREDIPFLLGFLTLVECGRATPALWAAYWNRINFGARATRLHGHRYYCFSLLPDESSPGPT